MGGKRAEIPRTNVSVIMFFNTIQIVKGSVERPTVRLVVAQVDHFSIVCKRTETELHREPVALENGSSRGLLSCRLLSPQVTNDLIKWKSNL